MTSHFARIDPDMTKEGAARIIAAAERDLARLRPKARKAAELKLAQMRAEFDSLPARS